MLRKPGLAATAAASVIALLAGAATAAERAGEAVKVQPRAYQKTGFYPFNLHLGDAIYRDAEVFTREYGSLAIAFDDGTKLTLAPNTNVTIDEYVYTPASGTGQAALTFGKGVLRMISGRIPHDNIAIRTPVATIGVRGTAFTLSTAGTDLKGWVDEGTVTARPAQSTRVYAFTAPATFSCDASACDRSTGQGPPPAAFPTAPPGSGFGNSGGGGGPEGHGGPGSSNGQG